ncbi:hypothetical protein SS1G_07374 [Sclerotinia sclerotiorum 1980 UF-70]|uniref:HTH psq-type domain-containing protein n=1 Tax=Sclerotinia sclerotiorum (strain ATCC 18683 / 1980 / Ss-1) TaxID=665079 RepID=A7EPX5_SCLS1|nr:hypothetical protein SS1G_07374 [Sclerotinia sclerotiorum 1980 UF-70]EDO04891.1 hypothetical protein SS1G_07374 [Sclerotinia sclerotiorum 1980 UF-70]
MQTTSKEARINLAIKAIRTSQNLSIRKAAKLYNIPHTTLTSRMNGILPFTEHRSANHKMTELEEKSLLQYILDIDERGFSPRITFCEDSEFIERWFRLVSNMQAKYSILDCDFYNFDETGFIMGQISLHIIVTKADRYGKSKAIQLGNREWAITIICIDGEGYNIPLFLIVKGEYHLSNRYTEALSQSTLMKSRIAQYQGSSPTPIFKTVAALVKDTELLVHVNTLLAAEVHSLRKANEALKQENVEDQIRYDEFTNDDSSARSIVVILFQWNVGN